MRTIKIGTIAANAADEKKIKDAVVMAKSCLTRSGYQVNSKDIFDEGMKKAIIDFQGKKGLDADGIVGYRTWEALLFSGKPASEKLTDEDFRLVAMLLDCETAALKAVQNVETGGRGGFFAPGKPAILFEGHIFWKRLIAHKLDPNKYVADNKDILYPKWEKGHYKGGIKEYERLEKARLINRDAADESASWGMFQIMGFNHSSCGENTVESFVKAMCESERSQLILSGRFINGNGHMRKALQDKAWAKFAKLYNGPAYAANCYDTKLSIAYKQYIGK